MTEWKKDIRTFFLLWLLLTLVYAVVGTFFGVLLNGKNIAYCLLLSASVAYIIIER